MTNKLDLNAIRKRAEAASSGPWAWEWADNGTEIEIVQPHLFLSPIVAETGIQADAEFIANARTDVPALIAEIERLRAENTQLKLDKKMFASIIRVGAK